MFNLVEIFQKLRKLFLDKACVSSNENIISIDWSSAAKGQYYQMAANTRVVGRMLGCVINRLKTDIGLKPDNVDLYGHSLGGQVVGFAGKNVMDPKIRQIIAADPAGPGFGEFSDKYKLAVTDAQSVVVIHTNGITSIPGVFGLGDYETIGNIDFYVNGGRIIFNSPCKKCREQID